jgi:hypothetical protein
VVIIVGVRLRTFRSPRGRWQAERAANFTPAWWQRVCWNAPGEDDVHGTRAIAAAQGTYFAATGIWSLVDADSFQRVTGPKHDVWLVKTVGALVTVIGAVLCGAAGRHRVVPEAAMLGVGCSVALGLVDVVYVGRGRIAPVYLLDAAAEAVIAGAWCAALARERGRI